MFVDVYLSTKISKRAAWRMS